jgi:transposase, IS30 family
MTYTHLSQDERYQMHCLLAQGISKTHVAVTLKRSRTTINRELRRNASAQGYKPAAAQALATKRQRDKGANNADSFTDQQWQLVNAYLRIGLSPEQVRGRLKLEAQFSISVEAIYQHIYEDKARAGDLAALLRCQKTRRKRYASGHQRRGVLKDRVCIEQRPAVVDARSRLGDWEGDTVIGRGHRGALVTLVERLSRYTLSALVPSKHSEGVTTAMIELLRPHKALCHTITLDNGKEFAQHSFVGNCLQCSIYFAHPYHSWERGLNENTNGLLRQYFPKKTNFLKVTEQQLADALYALNHRPRKCLGYKTPHEVFFGHDVRPIKLLADALCS